MSTSCSSVVCMCLGAGGARHVYAYAHPCAYAHVYVYVYVQAYVPNFACFLACPLLTPGPNVAWNLRSMTPPPRTCPASHNQSAPPGLCPQCVKDSACPCLPHVLRKGSRIHVSFDARPRNNLLVGANPMNPSRLTCSGIFEGHGLPRVLRVKTTEGLQWEACPVLQLHTRMLQQHLPKGLHARFVLKERLHTAPRRKKHQRIEKPKP